MTCVYVPASTTSVRWASLCKDRRRLTTAVGGRTGVGNGGIVKIPFDLVCLKFWFRNLFYHSRASFVARGEGTFRRAPGTYLRRVQCAPLPPSITYIYYTFPLACMFLLAVTSPGSLLYYFNNVALLQPGIHELRALINTKVVLRRTL